MRAHRRRPGWRQSRVLTHCGAREGHPGSPHDDARAAQPTEPRREAGSQRAAGHRHEADGRGEARNPHAHGHGARRCRPVDIGRARAGGPDRHGARGAGKRAPRMAGDREPGRRGLGALWPQRHPGARHTHRSGRLVQLGHLRLRAGRLHPPLPPGADAVHDGALSHRRDAAELRGGEPGRADAGAGADTGGEAPPPRLRREQRAAAEPGLHLPVLPRQLLDARARPPRPGTRRRAAGTIRRREPRRVVSLPHPAVDPRSIR